MRLHVRTCGEGPRTAVLLHGMMGSSESWWRVAGLLARDGYRVLAIDLPGHGLSPRDPQLSVPRAADAVADTVDVLVGDPPTLAMGHSFGGLVLAAAAERIGPGLAVYVDCPFTSRGGGDRTTVAATYAAAARARTLESLRASEPGCGERDREVEARAADLFDPLTGASVAAASGGGWPPAPGSIVVRPTASTYVTDEQAAHLVAGGVDVRDIDGASHAVWYSHFEAFVSVLPEVFGDRLDAQGSRPCSAQ